MALGDSNRFWILDRDGIVFSTASTPVLRPDGKVAGT